MNLAAPDAMRHREGHDWELSPESNVSFVCRRCGIRGFLPAKDREAGVKTADDCDHHVVESVLIL